MDVRGELRATRQPLRLALIAVDEIQELFAQPHLLKAEGVEFADLFNLSYVTKRSICEYFSHIR